MLVMSSTNLFRQQTLQLLIIMLFKHLDNFIDRGNGKRKLVKKKSISVLSKTVQNIVKVEIFQETLGYLRPRHPSVITKRPQSSLFWANKFNHSLRCQLTGLVRALNPYNMQ